MLDATPKKLYERKALRINPAKTCQPIGAMYAALGIHNCMPHSHGSQGCCSYHRMQLTRHFKDPIMATTSSFTEGASVFGGGANFKTSMKNIFSVYNPDIVAVHTTCLSETVGDDLVTYRATSEIPEGKIVIHANTPSYVGSHITGFSNMVKAMVSYLSENTGEENGKVNILPGFVGPADMREYKRILKIMGIPYIIMPDTSGVVDSPMTEGFKMFPDGGTKIEEIKDTGNSKRTFAFGSFCSQDAAIELEKKCKVPFDTLPIPIGIDATDEFLMKLVKLAGGEVPYEIEEERGQLVDLMLDTHQYFHGKKVAIAGDPDTVIPFTQFAIALGMNPRYVITGTPGEKFEKTIIPMLQDAGVQNAKVKSQADLFELHQWIKNEPVDLIVGNSHLKYIAREENTPLVRLGFPILDRYGYYYNPKIGYRGSMRLLEMMCDAILDKIDRECKEEDFELVL